MKRTVSIIGIALISIMIFAACPGNSGTEDNGESKSVTITNITGLTGKVSVWVFEEQGQPETGIVARGDGVINNGSVTVELKLTDESGNITADEWTGNGPFYIAVGQEGAVPDYTTSAKVDINSAGTEIVGVEFESSGDGGGGVLGGIEEGISAFIIFGNFEGEKTIDELLQQLVEEAEAPFEGVTLTYELFKTFG
ncbi:MAG: hypothetical protein LBD78_01135, partial [Spirochaetaceae bacterium]|nr:hypothetical protein [Spirochaetaceae bacterium]